MSSHVFLQSYKKFLCCAGENVLRISHEWKMSTIFSARFFLYPQARDLDGIN